MSVLCNVHANASSVACSGCKRQVCGECAAPSLAGPVCWLCQVVAQKQRGRRRALIVGGAVVLGVGGLVAFGMLGTKGDPGQNDVAKALAMAPPPQSAPAYRHSPNQVRVLRESMTKEPCNRQAALDLAELLNQNEAFGETIDLDEKFVAKCGAFPRLLWTDVYAHEQRSEWAPAAAAATTLIADEPSDSDFWWWRGQDRTELGQLDGAAADYRQSMAEGGFRFAAFRFIAVAEKQKAPCEAAFALRAYIGFDEDAAQSSEVLDRFRQLYAAGGCDAATGHGKVVIKVDPGLPLIITKAKLGAASGSFVIDATGAYTVLSKSFADKIGLAIDPSAPVVSTLVLGDLRDVRVATVPRLELGGASATSVAVAVVDSLPPDLDGVIGESFLWRFSYTRDDAAKKITLTEWKPGPTGG